MWQRVPSFAKRQLSLMVGMAGFCGSDCGKPTDFHADLTIWLCIRRLIFETLHYSLPVLQEDLRIAWVRVQVSKASS